MSGSSSTPDSADEALDRIHQVLDVADSESITDAERRAQERHERRLARIVADQWMYVARERLTLTWVSQMVSLWRKICEQSRGYGKQKALASDHYAHKISLKAFEALRDGSQSTRKKQSTAEEFHNKALEKKTFIGLLEAEREYQEHSRKRALAKSFRALKRAVESRRISRNMYDGAQRFYGTSLKKQALHGLYGHRQYLNTKLSHEEHAKNHWKRSTRRKLLRNWDHVAKQLDAEKKHGDTSRALRLKRLLSRCMNVWNSQAKQLTEERRDKIAQASELWNKLSNLRRGRVWKAWVSLQKEKNLRHLQQGQADRMYKGLRTAAATNAWRNYVREKERDRERSSDAQSYWRRQALRSAMAIWEAYKADRKRGQEVALKACAHLRKVLTRKGMDAWRPWHERHSSKERDLQKAAFIYRHRLQRWGCESIFAVGLMLQALRLQSRMERQPKHSMSTFARVAPYARKRWFLSQKRRQSRKAFDKLKNMSPLKAAGRVEVPLLLNTEPITHEVLLRIGLVNDGLSVQPQRVDRTQAPFKPGSINTPMEMPTSGRPPARGRNLLPPSAATATTPMPLGMPRPEVRSRPPPRRPAFLSQIPSTGGLQDPFVTPLSTSTTGQ